MTSLQSLRTAAILATLVLAVLAIGPAPVAAQERAGGSVVVEAGETVDGDLETFGGSVVVRGTVRGDVEAVAGDVSVAETGRITGSLDAAGGSVRVAGRVDGDANAASGNFVLAENGSVGGNLEAGAGVVGLHGTVDGSVQAGADRVVLGETARIGGDLTYGGELDNRGGTVEGTIQQSSGLGPGPWTASPSLPGVGDLLFAVYALLANLLVGAILLGLAPGVSRDVIDRARSAPLRAGVAGLGLLIAVPIVLLVLAVTLIGIPIALAGLVLFVLAGWLGSIYGAIALGTWLVSLAGVDSAWVGLVVGSLVVAALGQVPILGGLVTFAVFLLGFGALALRGWRAVQRRRGGADTAPSETDAAP